MLKSHESGDARIPHLKRLFSGIQFGMDDWGERELSQLAADGRRLTWRITMRLVCADALRLGDKAALRPKRQLGARCWAMTEIKLGRTPHSLPASKQLAAS